MRMKKTLLVLLPIITLVLELLPNGVVLRFGISFTGTSVNPARSFDPALFVSGDALANVWVFLVAPLVGGVLAALVYRFLDSKKAE